MYVSYNLYVHRVFLRISFAEQTSCLKLQLQLQLAFLMVLERNHKYTAQTYIASHPECRKAGWTSDSRQLTRELVHKLYVVVFYIYWLHSL